MYGDLHNHCGISYAHGSLEDALDNAKLQLDFCTVTGHAHWPDMPVDDPRLEGLVKYHEDGFAKLKGGWDEVQRVIQDRNSPEEFTTFLSFEWHSNAWGDYVGIYRDGEGEILYPSTLDEFQKQVEDINASGTEMIFVPHHIGYQTGYRGINWETFNSDCSPIVEICSLHGLADTCDSARPYLHDMGPLDGRNTYEEGLKTGQKFGVVGSTDHHSGHPGSYGHGLMGVWAEKNTRESIWEAIKERRTFACTGDRIDLGFMLNETFMGGVCPQSKERQLKIHYKGEHAIDYIDIIKNGQTIFRKNGFELKEPCSGDRFKGKISFSVGWGDRSTYKYWDVKLSLSSGSLINVNPHFRGDVVVDPAGEKNEYHYSSYNNDESKVSFKTRTIGNPSVSTDTTQGICLEVDMPLDANIEFDINGKKGVQSLKELLQGSRSHYTEGFVSHAAVFKRAIPSSEFQGTLNFSDSTPSQSGDIYVVKLRQSNNEWAISSPIWVE